MQCNSMTHAGLQLTHTAGNEFLPLLQQKRTDNDFVSVEQKEPASVARYTSSVQWWENTHSASISYQKRATMANIAAKPGRDMLCGRYDQPPNRGTDFKPTQQWAAYITSVATMKDTMT